MSTNFAFVSGKGGVGKTSIACAIALYHAEHGEYTLIVTTDPAPNLSDVFEQSIGHNITAINSVERLFAIEIDPDITAEEYRERYLAPLREILPPEMVAVVAEQLASPCTSEVASFDKFADFFEASGVDFIVFDTAPTGHTVRLLELPADWTRHIDRLTEGGHSCAGAVANIKESRAKYDRAVAALRNPEQTSFIFVVQPEATPIAETERTLSQLERVGVTAKELIINGIIPSEQCEVPFFRKRREMQDHYIEEIHRRIPLPSKSLYFFDEEVKGLEMIRKVGRTLNQNGQLSTSQ